MLKWWIFSGVILIFIQVFIGGVTRLTGSGLSITKWEIILGTFPPTNQDAWETEFNLYKATPQYQKLNQGMDLRAFKFIYFWEYFHRLWARLMGMVFIFPFIYLLIKRLQPAWVIRRLTIILLWAIFVAVFGWIMVASGLKDRPWVNAYNLTLHLCLAVGLMGYIHWTFLKVGDYSSRANRYSHFPKLIASFFMLICWQIFLGGVVSGMHAALSYPSWPLMNGQLIPVELTTLKNWNFENFNKYDQHSFMSALVQFLHRLTAYVLLIILVLINIKFIKKVGRLPVLIIITNVILFLQVVLGILVIINAKGIIPTWLGVMHQAIGMMLFLMVLTILYLSKRINKAVA